MQDLLPKELTTLLLASLADAAIATDAGGTIIYWNRAAEELYGFEAEEALGRSILAVTVPTFSQALAEEIMTTHRKGEVWRGNFEVQRKNGTRFLADVRNVPVIGADGEVQAIIGLSRDVSADVENARLRESIIVQLEETSRAKDEFLTLISHELRTPLTTILGFADLVTRYGAVVSQEVIRQSLLDIQDAARRMSRTIEDLVTLGRLSMEGEVELEPVMLLPVLRSAVSQHIDQNPKREVHISQLGEVSPALARPAYLQRVLENLLSNAEKFSPLAQSIDVLVGRDHDKVVVQVMDRGPGIEQSERDKVFEPFYRAPPADATFGAGLGLAACKRLMKLQGGDIWAEPRPGGGSCLKLVLPVASDDQWDRPA